MPCFFKGALGTLLVLVLAAIIVPQYSDYRAAAETSEWLAAVSPMKMQIEQNALRLKTLTGAGKQIDPPRFAPHNVPQYEIRDSGEIILYGGRHGQFVMLTPSLADGKVTWRCLGGSKQDIDC